MSSRHVLLIIEGTLDFSLALARQAATRQWAVARVCRDDSQEKSWNSTLAELSCERMFIHNPLASEQDYRHALDRVKRRWGRLDSVINFASHPSPGLFETATDADWQQAFEHNLLSCAHACKAATHLMKRQGHGQLVNVTLEAGRLTQPGQLVSGALQAGVVSLTEGLQGELAPLGIEVRLACVAACDGLVAAASPQTPLDNARYQRQLDQSRDLEQIAADIFIGLKKKEFLILTHKNGRKQWRHYRLHYPRWLKQLRQQAEKLRPEQRFLRRR